MNSRQRRIAMLAQKAEGPLVERPFRFNQQP